MIDIEQTIISQYANSPTIVGIIQGMNANIDPRADIDAFFDYVWNVNTAQGFGLDIWGRIVGVDRELTLPPPFENFGFSEAGLRAYPFNQAPFYNGIPPQSETYILADDAYRQLILVKALANIVSATAQSFNQLLTNLFGSRGRCYVNDLGGMQLRYTFEFELTSFELAILLNSGVFPRPAGVFCYLFNSELPLFGFAEAGPSAVPFGQGTFVNSGAMYAIN